MSIHRLFQCGLKSPKYSNHRQKAIPYIAVFQSLRSLRTATPSRLAEARAAAGISILAVLADRNHCVRPSATLTANFNRRGPCGPRPDSFTALSLHQSYFNPCGPCGPRPAIQADTAAVLTGFQSSRSLRTATNLVRKLGHILGISILAVLADRDAVGSPQSLSLSDFNPRGPCGPRPSVRELANEQGHVFQSSRSLRTATIYTLQDSIVHGFQSSRSLRTATRS